MRTRILDIPKTLAPKLRSRVATMAFTLSLIQFVGPGHVHGAGAELGVHSNVDPNTSINIFTKRTGHAWITLKEGTTTTTYGLWPDCNKAIKEAGLANGAGSDVRTDFAGDIASGGRWNKTYKLTDQQKTDLLAFIALNKTWIRNSYNCATWARDAVAVAGQGTLPVADTIGYFLKDADTPRKLSDSIEDADGTKDPDFPIAGGCSGSCTSCGSSGTAGVEDCATTDFCCEDCIECQSTPCEFADLQAPGACCSVGDNQCSQQTEFECEALGEGFVYHGDGTPCGADGTCIPTVSEWGVAVMTMLVLTAGTIVVMRRRAAATT